MMSLDDDPSPTENSRFSTRNPDQTASETLLLIRIFEGDPMSTFNMDKIETVYICHPFGCDPHGNAERVRKISRWFAQQGYLPLAPHIYLAQFLDEATEREVAMALCRRLITLADELLVFGEPTEGMKVEIEEAERMGVPVVHVVWGPQCSRPETGCLGAVLDEGTT